jgi:hypothetical protein
LYANTFTMDKTFFKMQTFKDADIQKKYWQSKTFDERLSAAMEMVKVSYSQHVISSVSMDKFLTKMRLRNG